MARSEYNNGRADNQFKDKSADRSGRLSAALSAANSGNGGEILKTKRSASPGASASRAPLNKVPPNIPPLKDRLPIDAPLDDLERRLQDRLALVDVETGRNGKHNQPASDNADQTIGNGNSVGAVLNDDHKGEDIPPTFEITDALDFSKIADEAGVMLTSRENEADATSSGTSALPAHLPSTEAMKWDGIDGGLNNPPSQTDAVGSLKKPGSEVGKQNDAGEAIVDDPATAAFTLMSALDNLPASPPHLPLSPSQNSNSSSDSRNRINKADSMDSMENGAASLPSNPSSSQSKSDGLAGSMDSMEFGMEPLPVLPPVGGIDNKLASSRAQLDLSLANLVLEKKSGAFGQTPQPASSNALITAPEHPNSQAMVRLDLDNDPPPLSNHLSRAAPNPGGNGSMIIAGFLGGLSIAFIAIWGYIYTLPVGDQSSSSPGGQGRVNSSLDRSKLALKVDNLIWQPGKALPLNIKIGGDGSKSGLLVKLAGLPGDGRLSNGFPTGNGEWIVPAAKLFGLTLSLAGTPAQAITVGVSLLEQEGNTSTGHFSSFSIYPENSGSEATNSVHKVIAANAGMAAIPMPRLVDNLLDGAKNSELQASATPKGSALVSEVDEEAIGGLPEDFEMSSNAAKAAAHSTTGWASHLALPTPPARAKRSGAANTARTAAIGAQVEGRSRTSASSGRGNRITDTQRAIIRQGNQLMRRGDIRKARQHYEKAYRGRSPEAALALGRSYDGVYLARIANANAPADNAKAMKLYRTALAAGLVTAQIKINALAKAMN